jgi:hypothetical protein
MKRFTSLEKWSDPWYRKLEPRLKCFWDWLFTNCDPAGTIDIDFGLASFQIGAEITESDLGVFGNDRITSLKNGKYWLKKFIDFQYKNISRKCPAHQCVIEIIDRLGLPYHYPSHRVGGRAKDKDKDKDKGINSLNSLNSGIGIKGGAGGGIKSDNEDVGFKGFWDVYPKKVGKGAAEKAWKEVKDPVETLAKITWALAWQKKLDQWTKEGGRFIPMPATYLNQRRWEDEEGEVEKTSEERVDL